MKLTIYHKFHGNQFNETFCKLYKHILLQILAMPNVDNLMTLTLQVIPLK